MELNVRLPSGAQVIIVTTPDSTVGDLKEAIQNVNGVSPIRQELSLGKKQALMNRTVLAEAGIVNGDEVNMHVHLRGGCGCCFSLCKALVLVLLSPFIFLVMLLGILVWLILLPCNCIGKVRTMQRFLLF